MDGADLGDEITDAVNSGINSEDLMESLKNSHNALQRYTFQQVLKPGIIALAKAPHTDARNKEVVRTCRDICIKMEWDY